MADIIITIFCIITQAVQEKNGLKILSIIFGIFLILGLTGQCLS